MIRLPAFLRPAAEFAGPPRLFLHIGMNKAGSSAIQRTLAQRERTLRAHGLLYPRTGRSGTQAHHLVSHVLGFTQGSPPPMKDRAQLADIEPRLRRELRAARCHAALVSTEVFTNPGDIGKVREFFRDWDVRIVVYLRRHDDWWASCYSQGVKTMVMPPWAAGFDSYIEYHRRHPIRGRYRRLVDGWAAVFGRENLIVRPYEAAQNQPSIVADLLAAIGFDALAGTVGTDVGIHNPSLGEREILVIDAIQHAAMDPALRRRLVKAIVRRPGQRKGSGFIAPALRRELVEEHLEDYRYIARTYLGRADGELFRAPLPDPDDAWTPPADAGLGEILEQVASVLDPDWARG